MFLKNTGIRRLRHLGYKTVTCSNDGTEKNNQNQNICLAFTVDDIDREYEKVQTLGAEIIEPPTKRPWGAINMSFYTILSIKDYQIWDVFFALAKLNGGRRSSATLTGMKQRQDGKDTQR